MGDFSIIKSTYGHVIFCSDPWAPHVLRKALPSHSWTTYSLKNISGSDMSTLFFLPFQI